VIFDEFHERSLQADLGLALCLESQAALRDDLKLLVMSATLDGAAVARLLGDAPVITSEGRSFPVTLRYAATVARGRAADAQSELLATILRALREEQGCVLVFLPGAGEIRRIEQALQAQRLGDDVIIAPLYGTLTSAEQDRAIAPAPAGQRKIVLATNIAETSLTIEGIRIVIDTGLMREPRFDPGSGMTRLETITISQASAEQRAGRAGRIEPGVCYRLWPEGRHLIPFNTPEIASADLAPLALELAQWGVADASAMRWLTPPPAAALAQGRELLQRLGAVDGRGVITEHGRQMAELPMHPRLAHMVLKGKKIGAGALACEVAALLGERDILRGVRDDADLYSRVRALRNGSGDNVDRGAVKRLQQVARQWQAQLNLKAAVSDDLHQFGLLLAWAYPDRIGQCRDGSQRYLLSNGSGAVLHEHDPLAGSEFIVAAQLEGGEGNARIYLAAALERAALEGQFADQIERIERVEWDSRETRVRASRELRFGALVLEERLLEKPDPEEIATAMVQGIRALGLACLPWSRECESWRQRVQFLHRHEPGQWPDVADEALLKNLEAWLQPFLTNISRKEHLQRLDLMAALNTLLPWQQQRQLDDLAPTHLTVPTGSRIALDYSNDPPVLAVRLQELFGATATPRIVNGKVAVLLHLLSPAHRPVQITQDLAGFWRSSYFDVKKEMKGRYPKHYWPDDPLQAEPTRRAKPK
jgi:ATP-dependent helicase HrpB